MSKNDQFPEKNLYCTIFTDNLQERPHVFLLKYEYQVDKVGCYDTQKYELGYLKWLSVNGDVKDDDNIGTTITMLPLSQIVSVIKGKQTPEFKSVNLQQHQMLEENCCSIIAEQDVLKATTIASTEISSKKIIHFNFIFDNSAIRNKFMECLCLLLPTDYVVNADHEQHHLLS